MTFDWKQAVRELLDQLPDDCDLEELVQALYAIEAGIGPWLDEAGELDGLDDPWSGR